VSLLELRDVRRTYARGPETVEALRGIDLRIEAGAITAVIGSSGSGKTTLVNIAGGIDRPTDGEVLFEGRRIDDLPEAELTRLRRRHVGMIFQDFLLVPGLSAQDNVRLPLTFSGEADAGRSLAMMRRTEIEARRRFHPHELSGGEQQRVAIARALIHGPSLLLADEPTGNLDSSQAARIFDLFRSLASSSGLCVLLVTHNAELAARADTVYQLRDGVLAQAAMG